MQPANAHLKWQAAVHRIKEEGMAFEKAEASESDFPILEDGEKLVCNLCIKEVNRKENPFYHPEPWADKEGKEHSADPIHKAWQFSWIFEVTEGEKAGLWAYYNTGIAIIEDDRCKLTQLVKLLGLDSEKQDEKDALGYTVQGVVLGKKNRAGTKVNPVVTELVSVVSTPTESALEDMGAEEVEEDEEAPF